MPAISVGHRGRATPAERRRGPQYVGAPQGQADLDRPGRERGSSRPARGPGQAARPRPPAGIRAREGSGARTIRREAPTDVGTTTTARPTRQPSPRRRRADDQRGDQADGGRGGVGLADRGRAGGAVVVGERRDDHVDQQRSRRDAKRSQGQGQRQVVRGNMPAATPRRQARPIQMRRWPGRSGGSAAGKTGRRRCRRGRSAVPCRLARLRLMCSSSRSNGATGPKP